MRIVHYFHRLQLAEGGTMRAAIDMASVMARRGHDVRVLTYDDVDAPVAWRRLEPGTPRLERLERTHAPLPLMGLRGLAKARAQLADADIAHLHNIWDPGTAQFAHLCRAMGVPYVVSAHGMLDNWSMSQSTAKKKAYLALLGQEMLDGAAGVHTTAEDELSQARQWLPEATRSKQYGRRLSKHVIPYITDLEDYNELPDPALARETFGLDDGLPTVLFISRLHPKKSPEVLIDAAELALRQGREFRLVLAGPGDEAYVTGLKRQARRLIAADRCKFVGMVGGELKRSLYAAADMMAIPTSQENFGLVFTESLACGTPIVCTKGTDIWRELDASGGALVAERSPEAFATAIGGLLALDPDKLRAMGMAGRAYVRRWLDPDALADRFERAYETVAWDTETISHRPRTSLLKRLRTLRAAPAWAGTTPPDAASPALLSSPTRPPRTASTSTSESLVS